jgi:hypothetical protein
MATLPERPKIDATSVFFKCNFDFIFGFEFQFEFRTFSVIVFDLCHLFCKKAELQGFIKKCIITPEPLEKDDEFFKLNS